MTISKAFWNADGDNLRLSMPFTKVDQERRIVSGFATLDNVDRQMDVVTAEASMKAFAKFRGNIREMHQPLAVGKMVAFKEDKYFDPDTKKMYSGVYVSAYISKGAQDTWEKVLDGTLSGFSIGGKMNKWDDAYDEKVSKKVRVIKEYDLFELSLVDTPANQFANILSIQKNEDGNEVVTGELADIEVQNVFWDEETGLVMLSENESEVSPVSGKSLTNIGFVETNDDEKTEMIKFLVDSAKGINTSKMTKEVGPMKKTKDVIEKNDEVVEEVEVAPEADAEAVEEVATEEVVEEVAVEEAVEEVAVEEASDVEKSAVEPEETPEASSSDEIVKATVAEIQNTLTSAFSDLAETVKSLHEQISVLNKSIDSVRGDVQTVAADLNEAKDQFNEFGKRVDAVEHDTAFRKSGDLGEIVQEQPEKVEKSLWGGRFLKTADLFK